MKGRNIETSLSLLREMEDKLAEGLSKRTRPEIKKKESQRHQQSERKDCAYHETPNRDRLSSVCSCQVRLDRTKTRCEYHKEEVAKQAIADELTVLKAENKEMRKYVKFLEKMNDQLKLQILNWSKGGEACRQSIRQACCHCPKTCNMLAQQQPSITIVKPKHLYPDFEGALSENNFLKRMSSLQQQEIDRLREIRTAAYEQGVCNDIYEYLTPQQHRFKYRTAQDTEKLQTETDTDYIPKTREKHRRLASAHNIVPPSSTEYTKYRKRSRKEH